MRVLEDGKQQVQVFGLIDSIVSLVEDVFKLIISENNLQTLEVIAGCDELQDILDWGDNALGESDNLNLLLAIFQDSQFRFA